jgi:hypothetical protein
VAFLDEKATSASVGPLYTGREKYFYRIVTIRVRGPNTTGREARYTHIRSIFLMAKLFSKQAFRKML